VAKKLLQQKLGLNIEKDGLVILSVPRARLDMIGDLVNVNGNQAGHGLWTTKFKQQSVRLVKPALCHINS